MAGRDANLLKAFGETKSLSQWAKDPRCNVSKAGLLKRLRSGMDVEQALSTPRGTALVTKADTQSDTGNQSKPKRKKRPKPPAGSPLKAHANGQWYATLDGVRQYFGPWSDHDGALQRYAALVRGEAVVAAGYTLRDLLNEYMAEKRANVEIGEIGSRHLRDMTLTFDRLTGTRFDKDKKERVRVPKWKSSVPGLAPLNESVIERLESFRSARAREVSPKTLVGDLQRIRTLFAWGDERDLLTVKYSKVAKALRNPDKRVLRRTAAQKPKKFIGKETVKQLLGAADDRMRCWILLALNSGSGPKDLSSLPVRAVDLELGWVDYPRSKTGVDRRFPLWPETLESLRPFVQEAIDENRETVFVTRNGSPLVVDSTPDVPTRKDTVGRQWTRLKDRLNIQGEGMGFYSLRHNFQTIAQEAGPEHVIRQIMGHADESISSNYRAFIPDTMLLAVTNHVRGWLFGSDEDQ